MPLQSLNLRATLFRCLSELKKNGTLAKDVIVRKAFFDDCKGERIQELLVSFSSLVLRKFLAVGQGARACIAARLATAKTITAKEQQSFLPLAIAHRASLTSILRKKKDLRERYKNFGRILDTKEEELNRRFEAVVSTQNILDKNPIPDHTVARVSKVFEENWQGDRRLLDIITIGERHDMKDAVLDRPFPETWQDVSTGHLDEATNTSWQSLLKDLEERVADQETRLVQWRNFRKAIQRDEKSISATSETGSGSSPMRSKHANHQKHREHIISPRKTTKKNESRTSKIMDETSPSRPKQLRKENSEADLKNRDLVFSPRKSPRKSMWPVADLRAELPLDPLPVIQQHEATREKASQDRDLDTIREGPRKFPSVDKQQGDAAEFSSRLSGLDEADESGFSEISSGQLHLNEPQDHTVGTGLQLQAELLEETVAPSTNINEKGEIERSEAGFHNFAQQLDDSDMHVTEDSHAATSNDDDSWISSLPVEAKQEVKAEAQSPNERDAFSKPIISTATNTAPAPVKSKASLMERTRQSMAFASPARLQNLLPEGLSQTPFPSLPSKVLYATNEPSGPTTLLERTRQSISLVPSKSKGSRKSMLDRRTSKVYPTNQFETPKKPLSSVTEVTPPEQLFSPGAGYDSVFKSRPKIAHSPNPSPGLSESSETDEAEKGRDDDGDLEGMVRKGQREESPLARMTAKV